MDVQAAAPTATIFSSALTQSVTAPAPPATPPAPPQTPASGSPAGPSSATVAAISANTSNSGNSGSSSSAIGPTPGLATLPAGPPDGTKKGDSDRTLAAGVAALYNVQQQQISVSFQIEQNPNEIVTVFTDKQTGKVIVQFPSETMIALAKLFDKLDGSVVNKKV
jgi:flagellar protein FlaG